MCLHCNIIKNTKSELKRLQTYLCFLPRGCFGGSVASMNTSKNMDRYFPNVTVETAKFLSRRSILSLKSWGKLAMFSHFFILLKNCIRLKDMKKHTNIQIRTTNEARSILYNLSFIILIILPGQISSNACVKKQKNIIILTLLIYVLFI